MFKQGELMNKLYIQNLSMIITNKCNLDCAQCLRGCKNNVSMSDSVIESTLNQIYSIGNLAINGGEPTLVLDILENIITYIIENHILIDMFTITINGTIYSEKLLKLLDEISNYIDEHTINAFFAISLDQYHLDEITKLGIKKEFFDNFRKYQESKYYYGYRKSTKKLFREGNATNLDEKLTIPLRPTKTFITYANEHQKFDRENGICMIGPVVTVNPNGLITECDASIEHQETLYNYGNVSNSIEEAMLSRSELLLKPKKFDRLANKSLKKYWNYNR